MSSWSDHCHGQKPSSYPVKTALEQLVPWLLSLYLPASTERLALISLHLPQGIAGQNT